VAKDTSTAVREICLWFPEAEEVLSHGSPDFRVRGKTYATYVINHHGDGRVALWLNAPAGAQEQYTKTEPKHFFVPPYVGPRGWLGVHLNKGISWKRIAQLVREAYEKVAPPALSKSMGKTIEIKPPTKKLAPEDIDPMLSKRAQVVLKEMRKICLGWPETTETKQFGNPVWRAGKRTFAMAYRYTGKLQVAFWVGVEHQSMFTPDRRFEIPAYMGHNGWIALDVEKSCNRNEIAGLAITSYRHFALQRMLKAMGTRQARETV
jgi:predicted DNA-binding protein (MmcQ/YjbR family)